MAATVEESVNLGVRERDLKYLLMEEDMGEQNDHTDTPANRGLRSNDIRTNRITGRRSFLSRLGIGLFGATAIAVGRAEPARASDFPKGSRDNDRDTHRDPKPLGSSSRNPKPFDSDSRNSKAVDSDENLPRDPKRSSDRD
jgi:hypothetical protein